MTSAAPAGGAGRELGPDLAGAVDRLMGVLVPPDAPSSQRRLYRSMVSVPVPARVATVSNIDR
jgi:hypothetical protein